MSIIKKFFLTSRYDKPHGILLLFFPCIWGISFNNHNITELFFLCIIFLIGASGMRALGCIWNDYNDKKFDIKVSRTKNRLIASNKVSKNEILLFSIFNSFIGSIPLYFLPLNSILISFCVLPLIFTYPFMKRVTWWPQLWLGINFNWGVLVGYSILGQPIINIQIIIFYIGAILFTLGYDTVYGFQDIKDDKLIGLKSTSIKFEKKPKLFLFFTYLACFFLWLISLILFEKNIYILLLFLVSCLLLLIKVTHTNYSSANSCYQTFKYNSYFAFLITIIFLIF